MQIKWWNGFPPRKFTIIFFTNWYINDVSIDPITDVNLTIGIVYKYAIIDVAGSTGVPLCSVCW